MAAVAVFDHGKTNLKLSAVAPDGTVLGAVSMPTPSRPGPPYRHVDLEAIERWLLASLRGLGARHEIAAVVATAHGSGCVLVDGAGPVLPMIDYEAELPAEVDAAYREIMPPFAVSGSGILGGATHLARQLFWLESGWPEALARARHLLPLPQYWAWRLSGVAALEATSLGAQSHFWDMRAGRLADFVAARGWTRLMPPRRPAWDRLGPVTDAVRRETGLPSGTQVLCGIHDSSASFYRWQRAGLGSFTLLSTGTWIVGLRAGLPAEALDGTRSMTANLDVRGDPVACVLTMTGRERSILAGEDGGPADPASLSALVASDTMALPSFVPFAGIFPGSAGHGRIAGPQPAEPQGRAALATLYAALVADACLDLLLAGEGTVVLDGGLLADPAFGSLVAALRPGAEVLVDVRGNGTTLGAALLWTHGGAGAGRDTLQAAIPAAIPGLSDYRDRWRAAAGHQAPEPVGTT
ncbi:FGGY-family carbohydrate kinase [Arenibaculum pallidiluteum]|uniref:FGGY-family carbohydrate kinase n=1 Tax=Arenibaculum pallidiluteum TaxID=2812559 RepID=UPI001EFF1A71|nr:FGGY family carbohydrate kinase [Arenibaculum pallidiluteum]